MSRRLDALAFLDAAGPICVEDLSQNGYQLIEASIRLPDGTVLRERSSWPKQATARAVCNVRCWYRRLTALWSLA